MGDRLMSICRKIDTFIKPKEKMTQSLHQKRLYKSCMKIWELTFNHLFLQSATAIAPLNV
jgi:hypothetical protein